ncbi:MAG: S41 family peptidase [Bacteroidetes bacterium]|nr:S41 family peptidase [Bacteroidota bacterium]
MKQKKLFFLTMLTMLLLFTAFSFNDRFFKITRSMSIFASLYKEVNAFYVDETNPNKLMKSGIDAMLASLDPYTTYISEDRIEDFRTLNTGQYGGIGASTIQIEDKTYISMIFEGYPAHGSKLQIGDQVLAINHISITDKSRDDINKLLKGQNVTEVILTVKRYGFDAPMDFRIAREKITIENVPFYGLLKENVGYIKLNEFTYNASRNVKNAVNNLKKQGALSIILDLRGNPGGLLVEAVNISNIFLPKGSAIVSTKGKIEENNTAYRAMFDPLDTKIPLAILINSGSASASEIVAGVIQDYDRGFLVGQKSYGKGLVQTTRRLSYNAQLKITTAKYYVPSGRCIQMLDYAHRRPDGSVGSVPDSLITAFKTRNGRTVFDGGGIDPDIEIEEHHLPPVVQSLTTQGFIFQYATIFHHDHEKIAVPVQFHLSEEEYEMFLKWLNKEGFTFKTNAEEDLLNLKSYSQKEGNWKVIEHAYKQLQDKIQKQKKSDIYRYKEDIVRLLEKEIVSRYYLEHGAIEAGFDEDPFIQKTIDILSSSEKYARVLE